MAPAERWLDRATLVDLLLVVVVASLQIPPLAVQDGMGPDLGPVGVALSVLGAVALLARRRHPLLVVFAVGGVALVVPPVAVALFVAFYTVGLQVRREVGFFAYGVIAAAVVVIQVVDDGALGLLRGPVTALAMGFPLVLGMAVLARRQLMAELVDRAERAEREQQLVADAAVAEERARLARELHDVVAHRVSLMVLHAGAIELAAAPGPGLPALTPADGRVRAVATNGRGGDPVAGDGIGAGGIGADDVGEAGSVSAEAALVGHIGRQALDELREMLDVLRVGDTTAPRAPLPGVSEVADLVEASRTAGTAVHVEQVGDLTALPGSVSRTVFRIVQEGLTNVHKHAPEAPVQVRVERTSRSEVHVEVVNGPAPRAALEVPRGGHGLIGVRERVGLLGGRVHAGPTDDGGWAVRATLPVGSPVRSP